VNAPDARIGGIGYGAAARFANIRSSRSIPDRSWQVASLRSQQSRSARIHMFSEDLIRYLLDEREREIDAQLRVRRLLGGRRPEARWLGRRSRRSGEGRNRPR
jgi:hypothetical protein